MSGVFLGNVQSVNVISVPLTPASVATIAAPEQTFTVPQLLAGDAVIVNKPTAQAGLGIAGARVVSTGVLGITYVNPTVGAIVPTAETYSVIVLRPSQVGNTILNS